METKKMYSEKELYQRGPQKTLQGRNLDEISFPLGGIGTGMISLGGWGQLREWEIMNRPVKKFVFPDSFFSIKIKRGKNQPIVKVLQGPPGGTYVGEGHSMSRSLGEGLPHFQHVSFTGSFPFANVSLKDKEVPLEVTLEAFNPFIPLNDKDSSIPVAILIYHVKNKGSQKISGTIFGNLRNMIGYPDVKNGKVNESRKKDGLTGLVLGTTKFKKDSPQFGNMALSTPWENTRVLPCWKEDSIAKFWEMLTQSDKFPIVRDKKTDIGTVAVDFTVPPGEEIAIPFFLTWYFPVFEHWEKPCCETTCKEKPAETWKNYYATVWKDSWDVMKYVKKHFNQLYKETKIFHDSLFGSSLPTYVLDAVSSQISILKTTTCLRLEDGTFYGFEGSSNNRGCCPGSCTHVWNYAQALPYLFPKLQRSMREADYANNMREDGMMEFRMSLPLGKKAEWNFPPAADGQMGGIMQIYREWRISGNDTWLKKIWPDAKKALEFAWKYWDADKDGVMEGVQHNTYDVEFYGPNTMMGSLYLGALRAAEEIARYLGENEKAEEYRNLFLKGSAWSEKNLFNGEYYEQKVNPGAIKDVPKNLQRNTEFGDDKFSWPRWQFGKACISDQLIGQWYARMLKLGCLYNKRNVRNTLKSIFKYNWLPDMTNHPCFLRIYAVNHEAGLLIGTWPKGERPGHAFYFADEVWTGIEYQVAAHMIYEGLVKEGLTIVLGARSRYTGELRNPWDEIECGHYYARAMASYSLILALSGFSYSAPDKKIGFAPKIFKDEFTTFFCVESGWGVYAQKISKTETNFSIEVKSGSLQLKKLTTSVNGQFPEKATAIAAGKKVIVRCEKTKKELTFIFDAPVVIKQGESLKIKV